VGLGLPGARVAPDASRAHGAAAHPGLDLPRLIQRAHPRASAQLVGRRQHAIGAVVQHALVIERTRLGAVAGPGGSADALAVRAGLVALRDAGELEVGVAIVVAGEEIAAHTILAGARLVEVRIRVVGGERLRDRALGIAPRDDELVRVAATLRILDGDGAGVVGAPCGRSHIGDAAATLLDGHAEIIDAAERQGLRTDAALVEAAPPAQRVDDDLVAAQLHLRAIVDPDAQPALPLVGGEVPFRAGRRHAVGVRCAGDADLLGRGERASESERPCDREANEIEVHDFLRGNVTMMQYSLSSRGVARAIAARPFRMSAASYAL